MSYPHTFIKHFLFTFACTYFNIPSILYFVSLVEEYMCIFKCRNESYNTCKNNTFFTFFLMLAYGQTEREEKTPTPEVSNYALTPDCNLDPEWSLDDTNINSLRRRKVLTHSLTDPCVTSHIPNFNISSSTRTSPISNPYRSTNLNEKSLKLQKLITYPKVIATYPRILPNSKTYPRNVKKIKKIDGRYLKPPSSQPPVFLKCKVKKKSKDDKETIPDEIEERSLISSATTDLDIQFSEVNFESLSKFDSCLGNETSTASENKNQTLKQYYNFEEKKVMRVAPHIRRKDVICDTVDAWSCSNSSQNSSELCRYKPLVFGGTYPIDLPVRPVRSDLNLTELNDVPIEKSIPKTYDIDVPTDCE